MRTLLTILLLTCSVLVSAQYNPYQKPVEQEWRYKEAAITIAFNIATVALDAMGDAYNDMGRKELGHFLNAGAIGLFVIRPFVGDIRKLNAGWYVSSYLFIRMGSFDPIYNATRGLPLGYSGVSSFWDQGWQRQPDSWKLAYQGLFFTVGFFIPINQL